jgi:TPR repeat protein
MAQYHLGILYADGEGVDIDIEHAKKLMRASSEGGYVRATEWLTNFENMTQESAESINALIYDRYSRFTKVLTFIRPTLWLFGLAYFIYFLVK